MTDALAVMFAALLGFILGGVLPLLVVRTPLHLPLRRPGVHCTRCGTPPPTKSARWPVWARLSRTNACVRCGTDIWPHRSWLEVANAALWAALVARFGLAPALVAYLVSFSAMLAITIIDARHYVIPTRLVYPTWLFAVAVLASTAVAQDRMDQLFSAVAGAFIAWAFFAVVWLIHPRGMGFGDVRLALLVGLLLGWFSLGTVMRGLLVSLILSAVTGLIVIALRLRGPKDAIPFGPFLTIGAAATILLI